MGGYEFAHIQYLPVYNAFCLIKAQTQFNTLIMIPLRLYYSRLFSPYNFMFSSIKNKQFSLSAQKSVLATAIINEIASSEPPTDFDGLSLSERILKLSPSINGREVSQQAKDELFALFTRGVSLDYQLHRQSRVTDARQTDQCYSLTSRQRKAPGNFIFFPTYLCTQPIFKILNEEQQKDKGVVSVVSNEMGKTVSFILYAQISKFIHRFYFQAQEDQEIRAEFQDLTERKLIRMVPKCWYWFPRQKPREFKETQHIFKQTTELPSEKRKILSSKLKNPKKFQEYLLKLYPQRKLIVDQAGYMTGLARSFNYNQSQRICNVIQGKNDYNYKRLSQHKKQSFQFLLAQFAVLKRFADSSLLFFSEPIQKEPYQASKGWKIGLGQKVLKSVNFQCQKALQNEKWATVEFWRFFLFQIQRRTQESEREISQIRRLFFESCTQNQVKIKSNFNFLHVRYWFEKRYTDQYIYPNKFSKDQIRRGMLELRQKFLVRPLNSYDI